MLRGAGYVSITSTIDAACEAISDDIGSRRRPGPLTLVLGNLTAVPDGAIPDRRYSSALRMQPLPFKLQFLRAACRDGFVNVILFSWVYTWPSKCFKQTGNVMIGVHYLKNERRGPWEPRLEEA